MGLSHVGTKPDLTNGAVHDRKAIAAKAGQSALSPFATIGIVARFRNQGKPRSWLEIAHIQ
jgi:hypothetical protein